MHRSVRMAAIAAFVLPVFGCQTDAAPHATAALPVDSGYVATDDGVRLFYRAIGAGPIDVVIPLGLYMEDAHAPLASADRRLIFYDPRARGRSEAGDRSAITLDRQVADLEALRRGLGMDSMALIGWSGLAMEMAVYAMRHPERVTRMVQVAPVAPRDAPYNMQAYRTRIGRTDTAALAAVRARRQGGDLADDPAGYCRALRVITAAPSFADPAHLSATPDPCRFPNEYPDSLNLVFAPLLASFRGYDWRDDLSRLTMPRLVIHGSEDAFPLEGSREWIPAGADARLIVIAGAGHFPFVERADAYREAVEVFLRGGWPEAAEP